MAGPRFALGALAFMTLVSVVALLAMLWFTDPAFADTWAFSVFYLSLFVASTGVVAWVFLISRSRFGKTKRPLGYFFVDAVRQGALVAGLLAASLFLQQRGGLNLISAVLLVGGAFFLEALLTQRLRMR